MCPQSVVCPRLIMCPHFTVCRNQHSNRSWLLFSSVVCRCVSPVCCVSPVDYVSPVHGLQKSALEQIMVLVTDIISATVYNSRGSHTCLPPQLLLYLIRSIDTLSEVCDISNFGKRLRYFLLLHSIDLSVRRHQLFI